MVINDDCDLSDVISFLCTQIANACGPLCHSQMLLYTNDSTNDGTHAHITRIIHINFVLHVSLSHEVFDSEFSKSRKLLC